MRWKHELTLCATIAITESDTTSATITGLVFELCVHRDALRKLQTEVDTFYSQNRHNAGNDKKNDRDEDAKEVDDYDGLHALEYLQACVNEALRLYVIELSRPFLL